MIEQNSIGNISIEVTPDILIALSRAIMRFHKLWSRQKELLDIAYWNSLTIKEKANRITAIKNEIDELTRCFGDLDDGETYGILPYSEQMHKIVDLFDKYVSVPEIFDWKNLCDPSRVLANVPFHIFGSKPYETVIYWENLCPNYVNVGTLFLCAVKLASICESIRESNSISDAMKAGEQQEKLRKEAKTDIISTIDMMGDEYSKFIVCMKVYDNILHHSMSITTTTSKSEVDRMRFTLEALSDMLDLFTADIIINVKDTTTLSLISVHRKKYMKRFQNEHEVPEAVSEALEKCYNKIISTCETIESHIFEGPKVGDRRFTKDTTELFGDKNSKSFRIMEIALEDKNSDLVTWNYETNRYEWHGSNQQLAYFMGALKLGDHIANRQFVFKKDMKGSNLNALVSQYWPAFHKTDFAQTRSVMKGDNAFPKDENYDVIQGWFNLYDKMKKYV